MMPVAVRAGEPRDVQPKDDPDMRQADVGDEAPKAGAPLSRGARLAQSLIDDQHLGACPAERAGAFDEAILEPSRLLMAHHLLGSGWADDHHRASIAIRPLNRAVLPG